MYFGASGNRKNRDADDIEVEPLPDDGGWQTAAVPMDTAEPDNLPEGRHDD